MTDNGAKALAERLHEFHSWDDYTTDAEARAILATGAVFLTAEEVERLRRIEVAAQDVLGDYDVGGDGFQHNIHRLRAALADPSHD